MFSMCSELTPRARIPDSRIPQFMQPCIYVNLNIDINISINVNININANIDIDIDINIESRSTSTSTPTSHLMSTTPHLLALWCPKSYSALFSVDVGALKGRQLHTPGSNLWVYRRFNRIKMQVDNRRPKTFFNVAMKLQLTFAR